MGLFWANNWQWLLPLIIGVVALVLAVSPFLQMIYGAPRIVMSFEIDDRDLSRYFCFCVWNVPITKGLLKALRVRREQAQDIAANFKILEQGTDRIVCPSTSSYSIKTQKGKVEERISLPASLIPAAFPILFISKDRPSEVHICKESKQVLSVGAYKVIATLYVGEKTLTQEQKFVIGDKYPYVLNWTD